MTTFSNLYLKALASGHARLYVRLAVLSLGVMGALISGDPTSAFAGDSGGDGGDPGGW